MFEEYRKDENGLSFGFFNARELITGTQDHQSLPSEIAIFGIKGDGNYLPVLKLADIEQCEVLINTASEQDMGFNLRRIKELELPQKEKPVIITNVEDSSSYTFLERNSSSPIFPIHAGHTEGWSLGSRLFMLICKLHCINKDVKKMKLYIMGNGKTIFYILQSLVIHLRQLKIPDFKTRDFLEQNVIILTNEQAFVCESIWEKKKKNRQGKNDYHMHARKRWKFYNTGKEFFNIPMIIGNFSAVGLVMNACNKMAKKGDTHIFVVSTRQIHDAIRAAEHFKYAINHIPLDDAYILSSISAEIYKQYKTIIKSIERVKNNIKSQQAFPYSLDDIILKKNLTIGNQIMSIAELLRQDNAFPGLRRSHLPLKKEQDHEVNKAGEISICLKNVKLKIIF